ncbi:MAG: SRPBCC domain-containing protein [Nitrososphaerales archaeon]
MVKTIQQAVKFNVSPDRLFDIYMDSKKHSAAINGKVSISRKVGARFSAHNGYIKGKNLAIVPKRMIVQSWRGYDWKKRDMDSTLILTFSKAAGGARINLVHANVPDKWYTLIKKGWYQYYWKPWRAYLRSKKRA